MLSSRPIPARGWKRTLLLVDAVFLIIMGVFGFVSDLASYVAGSGSFQGVFMNDPRVIGVVEAHGLALLTGVAGFCACHQVGGATGTFTSPRPTSFSGEQTLRSSAFSRWCRRC